MDFMFEWQKQYYFYVLLGNKIINLTHIQPPTLILTLYPNQNSKTQPPKSWV
jgi:hypothetical protein